MLYPITPILSLRRDLEKIFTVTFLTYNTEIFLADLTMSLMQVYDFITCHFYLSACFQI